MHVANVEVYSDATNNAVLRHPERRFPGVLIQGDSLYGMCKTLDRVCDAARDALDRESYLELNDFRNNLWARLIHYKDVLRQHEIPLPFDEVP